MRSADSVASELQPWSCALQNGKKLLRALFCLFFLLFEFPPSKGSYFLLNKVTGGPHLFFGTSEKRLAANWHDMTGSWNVKKRATETPRPKFSHVKSDLLYRLRSALIYFIFFCGVYSFAPEENIQCEEMLNEIISAFRLSFICD